MADGRHERTAPMPARGDAERPLADAELDVKLTELVLPILGPGWLTRWRQEMDGMAGATASEPLLDLLLGGVPGGPDGRPVVG